MMRSLTLPSRLTRTGCSMLALATVLVVGGTPATAQSFLGDGAVTHGSGSITTGANSTNITVTTPQTVIDWTPFDNAIANNTTIVFQNSGTTASFAGPLNFAVLNRINPEDSTRSITMNGTIQSVLAGAGGTNGSIYFYTPGGFVLGASSFINVGSLVLSASPITITGGNFINGTSNTVAFESANALARIVTEAGSQINALRTDSYVALVAPRVVHNGTITVNGQAALVGAEAATINFSPDGLFDITVDAGTTDVNGVVIGGSIGGAQSTGPGDNNRIYAVAVPKNQALTMALTAGASLGFNVAGRADVVGNAIVLSAGHNIAAGEVAAVVAPAGGTGEANFSGQNFTATSALTAVAKTNAEIVATSARTLHSDVTLKATGEARIVSSTAAGNLTIRGDVQISADRQVAAGTNGTAGSAALYADGGATLTAEQDVTLSADAIGANSGAAGISGGNATGGTVSLVGQFGGQINVWQDVSLSAEGYGGAAVAAGVNAGTGHGGTIQAQTHGVGSLLDVGGNVSATADGWGGYANCASCTGLAGAGDGGFIYVGAANDSDYSTATFGNFESFTSLSAQGYGGGARSGAASATGTGGTIYVWSQGDGSDVTLQGDLYAYADGVGGEAGGAGVNGGLGDGGNVFLFAHLENASLAVTGQAILTADGYGGNSGGEGCISCDASGGNGVGGEVQLTTSSAGPGASLSLGGLVNASANAYGGSGIAGGGNAIGGGATGSGSAGVVATFAAGTSIEFGNGFALSATAEGGDATDGNGGNALGGRVRSGSQTGATGGSLAVIGAATMDVRGWGGNSAASGTGGTGRGGQSDNGGNAGTLAYQTVDILTQGAGGHSESGVGGAGFGGSGWLEAFGAAINATGTVSINSSALGGNGATGGGSGTGGFALVGANSGSLAIGGSANVFARGTGGNGGTGTGGFGGGGEANIRAVGGGNVAITGSVLADIDGTGGDGTTGGVGDGDADPVNGVGGARIRAGNGSQLSIGGSATLLSRGFGGSGTSFGGAAFGGFSQILAYADSDVVVGGLTRIDTDAFARGGADGRGGYSQVFAGSGGTILLDRLNLRADGYGGNDAGQEAGDGYGGTVEFTATDVGTSVSVTNNITSGATQDREMFSADGFGGFTNGSVTAEGGDGTGGTVNLSALAGGSISLATSANVGNNILFRARGYGGNANANNSIGGEGFGGTLNLLVDGGTMTTGHLQYSSFGQGGTAMGTATNVTGGDGFGGTRNISVLNGATLTTAILGGIAGGLGGAGNGTGSGGNASGGTANLTIDNSTLIGIGTIGITTQVYAGDASGTGNGGDSSGPNSVNVNITNSTVNMAAGSTLGFSATSYGGMSQSGIGGSAAGGTLNASISGSTITGGTLIASATGVGGNGLTGGGNASGGTANFSMASSTINGEGLRIDASAGGGYSGSGTAGNGAGGTAILNTAGGANIITLSASPLEILATGYGGVGGTAGGGGFGGTAQMFAASGTSLTIGGITQIDANGVGGGDGESNGNGGLGDGGLAAVQAAAGATISFNNNVTVSASATGGNATSGLGGNALGGSARLGAGGGAILITGDLTLTGSATGGTGSTGGNATGLVSPSIDEGLPIAAAIYASNGGSVTVSGQTALDGRATGGTGFNGNGGNATGGEADVVAAVGGISLNSLSADVSARGGNGGNGGNGGSGQGGAVDVAFGLDNAAVNGTITLGSATINADGYGGNGGAGIADNFGGAGGAGGAGSGGGIAFVGSAAGGTLNSGDAILTARGIGGHGGAGGNGVSGTGGAGGSGGAGTGGYMQTGSISQSGALGWGGGVALADLSINTNAVGGNGGNGGSGGGGNGAGGNGGDAAGGSANFLIRGVLGTADVVTLTANATGGNGGTGSTFGDGGDARTGVIFVESKDRFEVPAQRGTLTANSIVGNAIATGGSGATPGTSTVVDGSYFRVLNGDATVGSVSITLSGNLVDSTLGPSYVSVIDGAATIIGSFSFVTGGNLSLFANNGDMHSGNLTFGARNFLFNPVSDPPSDRGTYFADSATITTGINFVTSADLVIGSSLVINAPGLINAHNFEIDGDLDLIAQNGGITANNLDVTGAIDLDAFGAINLNIVEADFFYADAGSSFTSSDITSASYIRIFAGDDVTLGEVVAGPANDIDSNKAIRIITDGSVLAGNILSAGGIDITALGSVTGGNVTTGDGLFTDAVGTILYGDISAGLINPQTPSEPFSVGLASGTSISVGNVDASLGMAFVTPGTLATGYLTTTGDVIGLVNGNISIGNISADDRVLLAGYAMYTDAGGTIPTSDGFNPEDIFAAPLVPTNGSITVGSVLAGSFQAAAGTSLTTGLIDTDSEIEMDAGGAITTGNLSAGDFVLANGGSITTGNIDANSVGITSTGGDITIGTVVAFGDVELDAFDDIVTGAITAGSIDLAAGDAITTGNLTTQQPLVLNFGDGGITTLLFPGASITLESGGNIATGDIDSIDGVHADAGGSIATGTIDAIDFVELYAVGGIGTGNIAAGQYLWVDSGGSQSLGNLNAGWDIELEAGGNVAFGNALAGTELDFEVSGNVSGGTIVAGATIEGEAGGSITLGNLTAGFDPGDYVDDDIFSVGIVAEGSISVGNVQGADAVGFGTLANLTTGNLTGGGLVMTLVGGNTTTGSITTTGEAGQVYMAHASMCETGGGCGQDGDFDPNIVLALAPVPTGGSILINGPVTTGQFRAAAGTTLTIDGNVSADSSVALSSGGAMLIESVDAGSSIGLRSDASITGDNLTAGTSVLVEANGAISLGNILAGSGISVLDVGPGSAVEIFTHGSIVTGNITTDGYVGLYAEVDVTVGAIDAGHDVIALVGDDASFGAITTPERFFLGGYAMTELVGGGENFNPEGVFGIEDPIATDGSALFAGSSSAASFEAYVGDDTTLASLDTDYFATIDTGGLFTLTGALDGYSEIISNDIVIGTNASVNNGYVTLVSRNPSQTLIGDGLDALGQGYRLSDAEADRIHTGFEFIADTSYGAAAKMIIGDLSINGGGESENDYEYEFETINSDQDNSSVGVIKVVGDVVFTGLGTFDVVSFDTNLFELDAATGSVTLYGQGTTLGGELGLYAPNIWIASGDILAKLEVNPTYSGYITELNAPAAVQRPEGVLRAASFDIDTDEEIGRSFLVQNTGTRETPAGFVLNESGLDDDGESDAPPGSVDLVINGQIITATGTLTGIAARDRLVTNIGTTEFTASSTVNGCALVGPCTVAPPPEPPKVDTITSADIQLTDTTSLGDGAFGNEGDIDDGESGDGESRSSPIAPPNPLFDSRPLTQSVDVDDPVSGAGNPSLYGETSDEDAEDKECDSSTDASCKAGTKGDGK